MTNKELCKATYETYSKYRDKKELTDYAVAKEAGISAVVLSEWKHGKCKPKAEKMLAISKVVGVPMEQLLGVAT